MESNPIQAMPSITQLIIFIFIIMAATPATAGSGSEQPTDPPSSWNRFWRDVADDWKKIGQDAKESGTEAGRTVKEEFREMPENFRQGFKEAQRDFKKATGSDQTESSE